MEEVLLKILRAAHLTNKNGEPLTDFISRRIDGEDFTDVNRYCLHKMLVEAYTAGAFRGPG